MKKKKMIIPIIGLILVGGISISTIHQQNVKAERIKQEAKKEVKETVQKNQEDPYKNLSKAKAKDVANLDRAVSPIVTKKLNKKPLDGLIEAEEALKVLDIKDADLKSIHEAYAGVINVVKEPDMDTLQDTRSMVANLGDADISEHMLDEYEDKLITIVSNMKLIDKDQVVERTKPLTPQQLKAKHEAKAKADKEAADKAVADQKAKEQAKRDSDAAQKADAERRAEAERVAANEAANQGDSTNDGGGYVPPANNGGDGSGYVPPANNGGGGGGNPPPPANNGGGASNNGAAQDAANNRPTPQPPSTNDDYDISGTNNANGWEIETGW